MRDFSSSSFAFTPENEAKAQALINHYPEGRQASAVVGLLDLAQRQCGGWIPHPALEYVAQRLHIPVMRTYEIATFYSMFNLKPVGTYHLQICTTTPCWLRGSDEVLDTCKHKLGIREGETTPDGSFTLREVECLGACVNAPVVQINDDYFEDMNPQRMSMLLDQLQAGKSVTPGSLASQPACKEKGKPSC